MGFVSFILVSFQAFGAVWLLCGGAFLLQAAGVYVIARRRVLRHAWLAWLPIGGAWVMGSISDQYQLQVKGIVKKRGKLFGWLRGISSVSMLVLYIACLVVDYRGDSPAVAVIVLFGMLFIGCFAAIMTCNVLLLLSLHDLYASCDPNKAVVLLILSILLAPLYPVFILACCRKDLGMQRNSTEV